jgi:hypothetical protein
MAGGKGNASGHTGRYSGFQTASAIPEKDAAMTLTYKERKRAEMLARREERIKEDWARRLKLLQVYKDAYAERVAMGKDGLKAPAVPVNNPYDKATHKKQYENYKWGHIMGKRELKLRKLLGEPLIQ